MADQGVRFTRMLDRRYKQVAIAPERMLNLAFPKGVESGITITAVWYDPDTDTFRFKIHSPEFPVLEELEIPPIIWSEL